MILTPHRIVRLTNFTNNFWVWYIIYYIFTFHCFFFCLSIHITVFPAAATVPILGEINFGETEWLLNREVATKVLFLVARPLRGRGYVRALKKLFLKLQKKKKFQKNVATKIFCSFPYDLKKQEICFISFFYWDIIFNNI